MTDPSSFDVLVIGAGMSGLLAASQLARSGKQVLLVEKLSFLGGRFSGFKVREVEIPTGAFHTIPHGDKGPFSQALRRLGIELEISNARDFASFHLNGEQIIAHTPFQVLKAFGTFKERVSVIKGLLLSWFVKDFQGSYGDWLDSLGISAEGMAVYDRFCQFTLSSSVHELPYVEGRKLTEMIFKYGLPGVPRGGAREVSRQLGLAARRAGVEIRKNTRVQRLILEEGRVSGAVLFDRRRNIEYRVTVPQVISNIGPGSTMTMFRDSGGILNSPEAVFPQAPQPAIGLKIQVISPKSLVDQDAIMFCLDTQRIAGILQASNLDPGLAPPGKHLLISHQVIAGGADWRGEVQLALEDWRKLFGSDFEDCVILGSSHFPGSFPVNWAMQGSDLREQVFADQGLWMVGDGLKPAGLMMVEGAAASAESVVRGILGDQSKTPWEHSLLAVWAGRSLQAIGAAFRGFVKQKGSG